MNIFDAQQEQQQTEKKRRRLKLKSVKDLERFAKRVARESYLGEIPVSRTRALCGVIRELRATMESGSLEQRLFELERKLSGRGAAGEPGISEQASEALRERLLNQLEEEPAEQEPSPLNETVEADPDSLNMFGEEGDGDDRAAPPVS